MITSVVIIVVMLLLSAFFSGMELAFLNSNPLKLEIDRRQSRMFDFISDIFARNGGQYITTILVGNNITLVVYSLCMSTVLRTIALALGYTDIYSHGSVILETVIPTIVVIFVAEYCPKSVVRANPNFYYRAFSPVMYFFYILLYPVARLTTLLSYGIMRLFGKRPSREVPNRQFDRNDLENLLDASSAEPQDGETDNEIRIFQNALDFADLRVRDCMVSRVDVVAVDIDDCTVEDLRHRFVETMYSRIFVWKDSIDNIVGYVNSKSMFRNPGSVAEIMMKVGYVPDTMPLQQLLSSLTLRHSNVAVVLDEFGGTAGIISLEDVLEEIFGEIEDEHDVQDVVEKQTSENEFVFSCRLETEYLNERYGLGIAESDEYDTLAGFIISTTDDLPKTGDEFETGNLRIRILKSSGSRIELARVTRKGKMD